MYSNLKCTLNLSNMILCPQKGLGLYLKYGWKEIDSVDVDTRPYGGRQVESTKCMMRELQPTKSVKA